MVPLHHGWGTVGARSIEKLKTLTNLERLVLQNCKRLGDDAVPILSSFVKISVLDLKGTAVTPQGIADLRENLPQATILF